MPGRALVLFRPNSSRLELQAVQAGIKLKDTRPLLRGQQSIASPLIYIAKMLDVQVPRSSRCASVTRLVCAESRQLGLDDWVSAVLGRWSVARRQLWATLALHCIIHEHSSALISTRNFRGCKCQPGLELVRGPAVFSFAAESLVAWSLEARMPVWGLAAQQCCEPPHNHLEWSLGGTQCTGFEPTGFHWIPLDCLSTLLDSEILSNLDDSKLPFSFASSFFFLRLPVRFCFASQIRWF